MSPPINLTEDERGCVHRALSLRRDHLRSELLFTHEQPVQNEQTRLAIQILAIELELIATTIRKMWVGTGKDNGNYTNKEKPP
jgi:hypothetical protein